MRQNEHDRTGTKPARLLVSANSAWNLAHFRKELIVALIADGHQVVAAAADDGRAEAVRALGASFHALPIDSSGLSPVADMRLLLHYRRLMSQVRPDAFLGFTVKPNIYGSLAAASLGIRTINNISGLGTAFLAGGMLTGLVSALYRLALRRSARVFFQNRDDMALFVDRRLVTLAQAQHIPGSGVDLTRFASAPLPGARRNFRFLLVSRLLRDKGVCEYVEAARLLRPRHPEARLQLLGAAGVDNRSAVPIADIERWRDEGLVEMLGESDDVRPHIAAADCIVLPSYREGLPRSLLEGAAMSRPLIASDVPGCRDVVRDGITGLLCEPRSATSLAEAMERMLTMPAADRAAMGRRAREMAEREYDVALVADAYRQALAR